MSGNNLIIIGASGFALEVYWLAIRAGFNVLGFLDDADECQNKEIFGQKVLGKIDSWADYSVNQFIIAIGAPRVRERIHSRMTSQSMKPEFATLIDPSAIIGKDVHLGRGSIVCAGVVATVKISVGDHFIVNLNSTIGHETKIGDFVTLAPLVAISGRVNIADLVEIGTGASVKQGLCLGHGAMLGMGGVLTKDIPENSLYFGNPAKFIKNI